MILNGTIDTYLYVLTTNTTNGTASTYGMNVLKLVQQPPVGTVTESV